jgi:hypothetical protein
MKILYKVQKNVELSSNEKVYLDAWVKDITQNNNRNILNLRDSLLPSKPSKLSIKEVDPKSIYALNTITKVEIKKDMH